MLFTGGITRVLLDPDVNYESTTVKYTYPLMLATSMFWFSYPYSRNIYTNAFIINSYGFLGVHIFFLIFRKLYPQREASHFGLNYRSRLSSQFSIYNYIDSIIPLSMLHLFD